MQIQPKDTAVPVASSGKKGALAIFNEAQNTVREQLMQGLPLAQVLESLINVLQSYYPEMKGSVLELNEQTQTLHVICAPSLPKAYSELVEGLRIGENVGSCGSAAYSKQRVIVENIAEDPRWRAYQFAVAYDLRACWSEPILSSDRKKVLGTFAMYYANFKKPTQDEVELLELAAGLAGTAIEWKQLLNERTALESSLRHANSELLNLNQDLDKRVQQRTAELEYQNRITKTITDNATAAMFMMDEKGFCTFMNPAAVAMIGFTLEEVRGKPLHDLIHHTHPDGTHYPMSECPIDRALPQDNSVRAHEDVFIRKDGTFFPVSCAASPIKENGVPVGTVIEVRDTTREKKAQQDIVESSEKFKMLLEAMPQIAWTANPDGELDYLNARWVQEYAGQDKELGLGNSWMSVVHPDDKESVIKVWANSYLNGIDYETQFRMRRNGGYRWHLVRALPLRDRTGEVKKWFGTSTDIHEQRMMTEHLAQAQDQLKEANVELSQKNLELTRTNADLDNFIYTASHDLRAPILNLEGLLQALEEELETPVGSVKPLLKMMDKAVMRFKKTIEDLTDISKIQRNIEEDSSEKIDLDELLEEVKESISELIKREGATIQKDFSEVESMQFSHKNLRSVLYNLVSNAIKYRSPDRPAEVKISTAKLPHHVRLRVEDNGLGVDMNYKEQLFSMFKRLHDHVEGSGVGLYIVKRIIENANGRIEVASELGRGTTIDVYLPM
ncbi:PAS domain S-box protein [uncultured Pontibacter sp.]|uniref:PAS domain S-box protein n=1 Tax=uncultured Pontibacter sp. TaxID=453356 RepID=UPI002604BCC1|nr:PAS domain S-box protein [uncultured Pontibacter sp.]